MILALILLAAPSADVNPPRVSHEPPTAADAQGNWRLWFEVRDESALFGAALYVAQGDGTWRSVKPKEVAPGWFEVIVPVEPLTRYFFEVFDVLGNGPSRVGSDEVPFALKSPVGTLPSQRPWDAPAVGTTAPVVLRWWQKPPPRNVVYGAAGVVVAGATAYGLWTVLRRQPISKVILVPMAQGALP